ncbi:MAG: S8 family peptidase [Gammaproteobacteria bacterium]
MHRHIAMTLAAMSGLVATTSIAAPDYRQDPFAGGELAGRGIDRADQWALERIGLDGALRRELALDTARASTVIAVIDTGLDTGHADFETSNLWRNTNEELDGRDDDGNGYVDDLFGWDFVDDDNDPADFVGHGTVVAGIIAATTGNGEGIAGVDARARIMPLRALNMIGRGYSTRIARAIYYAIDNGARIVNLSMAIRDVSEHEAAAIRYAQQRGVLVVVAAGNDAANVADFTPASLPGVVTVSATDRDDEFAGFSNWGNPVDIAAPGVDILSLRAANTDLMLVATPGDARPLQYAVGPRTRYYRATGTSFAAPLVTGVASLVWSKRPELDAAAVRRIVLNSAKDIDSPGEDQYTGYGLVQVRDALSADADFFIAAEIDGIEVVMDGRSPIVQVLGTTAADRFGGATLEIGRGEAPRRWKTVGNISNPARNGVLGRFSTRELAGEPVWTLRLTTRHRSGAVRQARFLLNVAG